MVGEGGGGVGGVGGRFYLTRPLAFLGKPSWPFMRVLGLGFRCRDAA